MHDGTCRQGPVCEMRPRLTWAFAHGYRACRMRFCICLAVLYAVVCVLSYRKDYQNLGLSHTHLYS